MPENRHTPGSWTAGGTDVYGADRFGVADTAGVHLHRDYDSTRDGHWADKPGRSYIERSEEEEEANARLIAAAPDLYAALGGLLPIVESVLRPDADPREEIVAARAALTKANGGERP